MTIYMKCLDCPPVTLDLEDLPKFRLDRKRSHVEQIARYLRGLLHHPSVRTQKEMHVMLPAVLDLLPFFRCSELDLLDALIQLKDDDYHYEIHALDAPLHLYDPLNRKPRGRQRWWNHAS